MPSCASIGETAQHEGGVSAGGFTVFVHWRIKEPISNSDAAKASP